MTSLILDVRDHIGGNCYDYIEGHGIRASKYGAHLFHTKFPRVWDYVQNFSEWMPFDHRVKGRVADAQGAKQLVPIPPVQETVNTLFGEKISSEEEMQKWYDEHRVAPAGGGGSLSRAPAGGSSGTGRAPGARPAGKGGRGGGRSNARFWRGRTGRLRGGRAGAPGGGARGPAGCPYCACRSS